MKKRDKLLLSSLVIALLIFSTFGVLVPHVSATEDTDRDGTKDNEDDCPTEPGPPENNGCPITGCDRALHCLPRIMDVRLQDVTVPCTVRMTT